MARIDSHAHLIPPEHVAELEQRSLLPIPLPPWSADLTYQTMARHGIDAAVLSLSPPGVFFGDGGLTKEFARSVNGRAAALVRSDDDRLTALVPRLADRIEYGTLTARRQTTTEAGSNDAHRQV